MKRILVIGSGGAGKSTFSRVLGEKLNIPVVHLDKLYWRAGWVKVPKDEWQVIVRREIDRDSWVMDGNFGGTREIRMQACDTVIFLDIPRRVCLYRILKRSVIYHGKNRPDMSEGCHERFDWEFVLWVWNYQNRARPRILEQLSDFEDKNIVILRSVREVDGFLNDLK